MTFSVCPGQLHTKLGVFAEMSEFISIANFCFLPKKKT